MISSQEQARPAKETSRLPSAYCQARTTPRATRPAPSVSAWRGHHKTRCSPHEVDRPRSAASPSLALGPPLRPHPASCRGEASIGYAAREGAAHCVGSSSANLPQLAALRQERDPYS